MTPNDTSHIISSNIQNQFLSDCLKNKYNKILLDRLSSLNLPDCWLVAGCLFQTVWNIIENNDPHWGIKDYDVFYFDDTDLSYEAEDEIIKKGDELFKDLPIEVEIRNQARVHLWYEEKFSAPYPKLENAKDGINKFLIKGTCLGISCNKNLDHEIYAPYGINDVYNGYLKPNDVSPSLKNYSKKSASYKKRWPHLIVKSCDDI